MSSDGEMKDLYNLNLERSRYSLMLHITNDIFFEYNCADDILYLFNSQKGEGATSSHPDFRKRLASGDDSFSTDPKVLLTFLDNKTDRLSEGEVKLSANQDGIFRWYKLTAKYSASTDSIIGNLHDINSAKEEVDKLKEKAQIDPLSKVYNKSAGIDLTRERLAALPADSVCGLAVLDIDNFKTVNDTYGHLYGDAVISMVAGSIKNLIGPNDLVGRFGGDEFFVFIEDGSDSNLENTLENIRSTVFTMNAGNNISCSIGCTRGHGGSTWEDMFKQADSALYKAKKEGKNRYEFFTGVYYDESISYADNLMDPDHSDKEHSMTEVALEIASKSLNSEDAIFNIMRHVAILMQLDEIVIYFYDVPDSRIDVLFRYYKEFDGQFNVVSGERKKGHYAPEDLVLFRQRLAKTPVIVYTPEFKEGFMTKFYNVLSQSDDTSNLFVGNASLKDDSFCVIGYKSYKSNRKWTAKEKKDLLEVEKILAMYLKSAYTTTTREKAMEEKLNYTASGAFTLAHFYQMTGRVTCTLSESMDKLAVVHFHITGLYDFICKYGRGKGDEFVNGFVQFLFHATDFEHIVAQYDDLVNFAVLTAFDDIDRFKAQTLDDINRYTSQKPEYKEFFTIRATICPFKEGLIVGDALETAKNVNLHAKSGVNSVHTTEYVEIRP